MDFKKTEICFIILKIAAIVFVMNTISGILFGYLPSIPTTWFVLLDSIVVIFGSAPLIAVFVIHPYIVAQSQSEENYKLAIKAANNGLWDWDIENDTLFFSEQFLLTLGLNRAELHDIEDWVKRIHPEDQLRFKQELDKSIAGNRSGAFQCEYRIQHAMGHYVSVLNRWLCVKKNQYIIRAIGAQTDLTPLKKAEEKWVYETSYDSLTRLPNRRLILEKIEEAMRQQHIGETKGFVFLFIDLDNFKRINDSIGHFAGDELLVKIAEDSKKP